MNESTDAANIFAPLWKRKWLILLVAIVVAGVTYEYYKHQTPNYLAKASLYLGGANEQQVGLSGASTKTSSSSREIANQVELINSSIVGKPARKRLRAEGKIAAARGRAKATASASSNFITITTEAHQPRAAMDLGNAYATEYIKRQRTRYFAQLKTSISIVRQQLRRIESQAAPTTSKGKPGEASKASSSGTALQAATLASKLNQLESGLTGYTGVQQVGPARANPLPTSPTPKKNAIFGFVLALLLASVAVYVASQFNRRLASLADVEKAFGAQVLAALPKVRSPVLRPGGERGPAKSHVEPLRRLHTSLLLGTGLEPARGNGPRTLLFISADPGDGRSTVIANLARVQCASGARVVVLEADLRRPALGRLLGVDGTHTLAQVLEGRARLEGAMQTVEAGAPISAEAPTPEGDGAAVSTVVTPVHAGSLSALLNGEPNPNPPALLASAAMQDLLRSLAEDFDYVLIDAPPPLEVSDVMPLLASVDGIILIARIGHTRDQSAERLVQLLGRTASAPVLGVVANCASPKDVERYGFSGATRSASGRKFFGR